MKLNQIVIVFSLLLVAGCDPKIDNRGYVKNAEWKDGITIGQTTKQDVINTFGSPSSQSTFGEETWYYIAARKETTAFLRPEVVEQHITRLTFDSNGVVTNMEAVDGVSMEDFELAKRVTPTEGHQLGFFEQILGNIGRFNQSGDSGSATPGRRAGGHY